MTAPAPTLTPAPERPAHRASLLDLKTRALVWLGGSLIKLLGLTWRVRVYGREALEARTATSPRVIYALWHGQMLPILYAHHINTGVLISEHRDGEIIARIVKRFGFFSIRGSSSRGGARALLELVQVLRAGSDIAVTPDGPRGPRHSFAAGALVVAYRAHAKVVTITAATDRKWQLKSWDGFEVPKPFARVAIVYGTSLSVDGADVRDVSARTDEFAAVMSDALARAEALLAAPPVGAR